MKITKVRGWYCRDCGKWVISHTNTGACICYWM